jgi:hypothetical protein
MKHINKLIVLMLCLGMLLTLSVRSAQAQLEKDITAAEIKALATEAYIYGLQQVVFYETRYGYSQLETADNYVGINNFWWLRKPITPEFRSVVTPNATTMYGIGFADLSREPLVVELPAIPDIHASFQIMDQYGDYYFYAGNQFTGRQAQKYLLVGPDWQGHIPAEFAGVQVIKAPSATSLLAVRQGLESYADEDLAKVNSYQNQITATPLGLWLANGNKGVAAAERKPQPGTFASFPRMAKLTRKVVESLEPMDYYQLLSLVLNDPTMNKRSDSLKEVQTLERLARIGLGEGLGFNPESLTAEQKQAFSDGFKDGYLKVKKSMPSVFINMNGWMLVTGLGDYGTDYLTRAIIGDAGWGGAGVVSHNAAFGLNDSAGEKLNGKYRYTMTFDTRDLPPTTEFWSLPIYDIEGYFIDNEINRYTVNSYMYERGEFHVDDQGMLTFYVQHDKPATEEQQRNWLPAPEGPFRFAARFYGPKAPLMDGSYTMPGLIKQVQ